MVALTSVAAMPGVALNAIDFANEDLWGKMPRYGLDEAGREEDPGKFTGICYWYYGGANGNGSVITDYSLRAGEMAYDGFGEGNPKPFYMHERVVNEGFLDVGSLAPLCRTFNEASSNGVSAAQSIPAKNDLFVDALVKFVPRFVEAGEIPDDGLGGKAKFMVCLATSAADPSQTNLVVTAGYYGADGALIPRTYVAANKVQSGRWYRLTARAFRNAASNDAQKEPAFALFLDGALVTCAEGAYEIGDDAAKVRDTFAGNEYYSKRALFPPLRAFEPTPKLSGFAMRGCAGVDDFGVVTSGNPLSRSVNEIEMTVAIDPEKVEGVVCTIVGGAKYEMPAGAGEVTFPVGRGARVEIAASAREGYRLHEGLTILGNVGAVESVEDRTVTLSGEFDDAARVVARINAGDAYFLAGGKVFERMDEAIEAAALAEDRTLALGKDVTLDPTTENGQMRVKAGYEITLDLRGRGITGEHFMDESTIYDQGRLTVVDSVGGGFIHAPGTAIEVVNTNAALVANHEFAVLTLGSEALADKVFTVRGRVRCDQGELVVKGGTYLTPWDLEPTDEFYLADYVPDSRYAIVRVGSPEVIEGRDCRYWGVTYDGKMMVRFKVEHGAVSPEWTTVEKGSTVERPFVEATGYTIVDWVDEATGLSWNFELDTVEKDVTIAARQELDVYSIDYAGATISPMAPDSYTLEMERTLVPPPSKARENYVFAGWLAEGKGKYVDFVGKGAVYVGTTERVIGDLRLVAQWTPAEIVWTNAGSGLSESNGTYAGSWSFTIPAKGSIGPGDRIVIDRISLCVVNPHLYPKTAARLAVTNAGMKVVSRARTYGLDEETKEYAVARRLPNGRAAVDYEFDDLVVEAGRMNFACLVDGEANPMRGFLRFTLMPGGNDAVFGNCTQPGGDPECARYMEFCPTYEVSGHLEEGDR